MKQETLLTMRFRSLKAIAVVLAILVAAPGIDLVARFFTPSATASADEGIDAGALIEPADAQTSLERIEAIAAAADADVPEAFADEVGFLPGARDVRASSGGEVVGYVAPGNTEDALAKITERMKGNGWTAVELGEEVDGATFVKSSGSCTWALVTCTQIGSDTSVVARCVIA